MEGGENTPVTLQNCQDFAERAVKMRLHEAAPAIAAIHRGLASAVRAAALRVSGRFYYLARFNSAPLQAQQRSSSSGEKAQGRVTTPARNR